MRVLLVTGEFPPQPGGVGDYTDRLAGALADQGHTVAVLTSAPSPAVGAINGDAVWANREGATVWRIVRRWNMRAWQLLAERIRAWRPDVVHFQYQAAAYGLGGAVTLYPWLLRTWNIRPLSVVTFHDLLTPHMFPLSGRLGLDRQAVTWFGRGVDAAIATNAEDAERLAHLRTRRVWQAPIGANIPVVAAGTDGVRARYCLAPGAPLLAYFGFYNASKGLEELFTAFAGLARQRPDARLLLIGGGVGETDATNVQFAARLRRHAEDLRLADRLIWTGYVDAAGVSLFLQAADLIVLPFRDGVSLRRGTLMAALSHGCAIVSTHATSPVTDLESAVLLCRANDPADLQRAITEGLDTEVRERLRREARAVAAQYSWETIAASHTHIYRALCHTDC
ncbi:MAG TPA: glycosyltransferase family 4 protein [Chloroflexota bacterium]|nr:glycosyltransferase family 4 protein [Chloroflexota bacterium]